jgi:2-polyprenyl-3-methyl-5-hydroxy-6-metoxy-1,4-benzoquinol methylase
MGLFNKLYSLGIRLKGSTEYLSYGRDIVLDFVKGYARSSGLQKLKVLDIGCGSGDDLIRISM